MSSNYATLRNLSVRQILGSEPGVIPLLAIRSPMTDLFYNLLTFLLCNKCHEIWWLSASSRNHQFASNSVSVCYSLISIRARKPLALLNQRRSQSLPAFPVRWVNHPRISHEYPNGHVYSNCRLAFACGRFMFLLLDRVIPSNSLDRLHVLAGEDTPIFQPSAPKVEQ